MRRSGKSLLVVLAIMTCGVLQQGVVLAARIPSMGGADPAAQINQTRAYLEEQALRRRLEEEKNNRKNQVEAPVEEKQRKAEAQITFTLRAINTSPSEVLTKSELEELKKTYLQREINLDDLYELVDKINALYAQKGYVVCKAFLPRQTISGGVATITLIEGKTGNIEVTGNKSTTDGYIKGRINLHKDKVSNLKELNQSLLWFNGTNDVQLRIKLEAGKEPGTTDYVLTAAEPQREQGYLLVDTAGTKSTGIWRESLGWYTKSLSGNRDTLMLSGMRSDGTLSGSLLYSIPISKSGTKLNVQYMANKVKIKDGDFADLDIKGSSTYYGVGISQPLAISQHSRSFVGLDWSRQTSKTDILGDYPWIDDTVSKIAANINFTHYGDNVVWYHRHSLSRGSWTNIQNVDKDYTIYSLNFLRQQVFKSKKVFNIKLNAQLTGEDNLPSADQFYIGGVNSVRGYIESLLSGDSGVNLSAELSVPEGKNSEWVFFADAGSVFGESAFDDHTLYSVGAGYRLRLGEWLNSSIMLGIPLATSLNGTDYDKYRLHFNLYMQF